MLKRFKPCWPRAHSLHSAPAPAEAVAPDIRSVFKANEHPGLSYCNLHQLRAVPGDRVGRFLSCIANPYYISESEPPAVRVSSAARPRAAARPRQQILTLRTNRPAASTHTNART